MRAIIFVVLISALAATGCNKVIYVEEETPPGSVPPPPPPPPQATATTHDLGLHRDAPPVNGVMPTAVTREDEGRTLEAHIAVIAEQFADRKAGFRSQLPMLVGMICFSIFSLWLLKQPMEMRTSAM